MVRYTDGASASRDSVGFFRRNHMHLVDFVRADLFFYEDDAVLAGFWAAGPPIEASDPRFRRLEVPTMVLTDAGGDELWVGGANCGYGGEGPSAAVSILRLAGCPASLLPFVTDSRFRALRLAFDRPEPVIARPGSHEEAEPLAAEGRVRSALIRAPHPRMLLIDGRPSLLLQDPETESESWTRYADSWCDQPATVDVYLADAFPVEPPGRSRSAFRSWDQISEANVVVTDRSGRLFCGNVPLRDGLPRGVLDYAARHGLEQEPGRRTRPVRPGRFPAPSLSFN
jgi:hypothetical protein